MCYHCQSYVSFPVCPICGKKIGFYKHNLVFPVTLVMLGYPVDELEQFTNGEDRFHLVLAFCCGRAGKGLSDVYNSIFEQAFSNAHESDLTATESGQLPFIGAQEILPGGRTGRNFSEFLKPPVFAEILQSLPAEYRVEEIQQFCRA